MLPGVNIEEIKKYNESIKGYKEKSNRLATEIEINTRELNNLCAELTTELGIQVTVDNIESIYNERMTNIFETIKSGNEIIARIEQEVTSQDAGQLPSPPLGVTQENVGMQQPANNMDTQRTSMGEPTIQPVFSSSTSQSSAHIFGDLPPMFSK